MASLASFIENALGEIHSSLLRLQAWSGLSSTRFTAVGLGVVHETVFITLNIIFYLVSLVPAWRKYKVQPDKKRKVVGYVGEVAAVATVTFLCSTLRVFAATQHALCCIYVSRVIQLPFMHLILWAWDYRGGRMEAPLPPAGVMGLQLLGCWVILEVYFYAVHRLLHWGPIYRRIHKQHHEFTTTVGVASEYAHPVEDIVANIGSAFAGPVLFGLHPVPLFLWIAWRVWESVETHSGYALPWSHMHALTEMHDFHHSHPSKGCYAGFFMDWLLGTDVEFRRWKEEKKRKEGPAKATAKAS